MVLHLTPQQCLASMAISSHAQPPCLASNPTVHRGTHPLVDLHAQRTLGDVPHHTGLALVPLVGHALRMKSKHTPVLALL